MDWGVIENVYWLGTNADDERMAHDECQKPKTEPIPGEDSWLAIWRAWCSRHDFDHSTARSPYVLVALPLSIDGFLNFERKLVGLLVEDSSPANQRLNAY